MRVLHVITGLAAGGAEHQLRLLLRRLRRQRRLLLPSDRSVVLPCTISLTLPLL